MSQFVFGHGINIPIKIHGQYPQHLSLETSSSDDITDHHECILLVMADDNSEVVGDYTMLNQLGSNKVQVYVKNLLLKDSGFQFSGIINDDTVVGEVQISIEGKFVLSLKTEVCSV